MRLTHKRFTNDQTRFAFGAYVAGRIKSIDVQEALAIGTSPFSGLLTLDQHAPPVAAAGRRRSRRRSCEVGQDVLGGIRPGCAYRDASQSAASRCLDIPRAAVWEGAHPQGFSEFLGGEPNDQR